MTVRAREVLSACEVVFGYKTYLDLISPLLRGQEIRKSGMRSEVTRCDDAILEAGSGRRVALISSGDAGVYGMAGLAMERLLARQVENEGKEIYLEVVPGVTAAQAAASLIGAPLMNDYASVSLSDLLTPWETIVKRLTAVAAAGFVIVLINPKSKGRTRQIVEAREILLRFREGSTPVGIVRSAHRGESRSVLTDLDHMLEYPIDMLTTVIIGNADTKRFGDLMITKRGYKGGQ